jgi:purine-binding chemotaxis protein CheW
MANEERQMDGSKQIIVFSLGMQRYGIPLTAVECVVRMVEVTPLPDIPTFIRGVINVHGEIMPVIDLRRRFGLPERTARLQDQLLITRWTKRSLALMADMVSDVYYFPELTLTPVDDIFPGLPLLAGVAKLPDGMILIHDLDKLLSTQDKNTLDEAMGQLEGT